MALEAGTRLGHYEVVSSLGAGGMGEVYRAKDTKLGREVAIKLLLEEVSQDPERLARFEREAKVLASLNHNNIATLYGFESEGDKQFLVMEVVEGETLAERIKRGAIPVDEALPLFLQIAEGLEAAHDKGIIHRDLKPANIKVSDDGNVKILDFGLAKAMAPAGESQMDPSESPTITAAGYDRTHQGQILGTAAYMSPEQARGGVVDHRSDVWAFGCCLFEALSAERTFQDASPQGTLAKVLEREPDWNALSADVPELLGRLLRRCLKKSPRERLRDIGQARLLLEEAQRPLEAAPSRPVRSRSGLLVRTMGVALVLLAGWLAFRLFWPSEVDFEPVRRVSINLPDSQPLHPLILGTSVRNLAISPDGQTVIWVSPLGGLSTDGGSVLVRRRLGTLEADMLPGTEGGTAPFFSPDGEWLGFSVPFEGLKRIHLAGGSPELLYATGGPMFKPGAWCEDGFIYFVDHQLQGESRLMRLPEGGGRAEEVGLADDLNKRTFFPAALPGGRALLLTNLGDSLATSSVDVLDLATWKQQVLIEGAQLPRFVGGGASLVGHIVYSYVGGLKALPFDARRLVATGPAVDVTERGMQPAENAPESPYPLTRWQLSRSGSLVYPLSSEARFVIVSRDGGREVLAQAQAPTPPGNFPAGFSVSPDGRRIAVNRNDGDLWVYDLDRESSTRATEDPGHDHGPIWSRNGRHLLFASDRAGEPGNLTDGLYRRLADGTGEVQLLGDRTDYPIVIPTSLSQDETLLLYFAWGVAETKSDIWLLPLDGDGSPEPLVQTEYTEQLPSISPDGRWFAYESDRGGQMDIYVQSLQAGAGRVKISTDGGRAPAWHPSGKELLFWNDGGLFSATIEADSSLVAGLPQALFEGSYSPHWDLFPNGERFLMAEGASGDHELIVVENWDQELKRLVPTD